MRPGLHPPARAGRHTQRVRLFVAMSLPADVMAQVRAVERPEVRRVRWTTDGQWHVTLRFLGEVGDPDGVAAALDDVPDVLRGSRVTSVTAVLGPAAAWFAGRRVLQVPVTGIDDLAAAVGQVTAPWGQAPDDHGFTGHLTLARVGGRDRGPAALAGAAVAASWMVPEVRLMSSVLGPGGSRYEVVSTVSLGLPEGLSPA